MSLVHLILGGARSGKSRHALSICGRMRGPHKFIATAQAYDDEMTERIRQHREERANFWHTIEAPIELARAITSVNDGTVLVEGMVMTLEPSLTWAPGRMMVHEENLVIRSNGPELLSRRAPAELPILG